MTGTVSRSLAEIEATARKAARGSGCDWSMAEEAGVQCRLSEAMGLPGVAALAALLAAPRLCSCAGCAQGPGCGIAAAASLADRIGTWSEGEHRTLAPMRAPELLSAPLWLGARRLKAAFSLEWDGFRAIISGTGATLSQPWPVAQKAAAVPEILRIPATGLPFHSTLTWRARDVPADAWDALERRAARTLVPETELSRARGAGPAQSDTD